MSITLTNALSVFQGAAIIESNPQVAVMTISIDYQLSRSILLFTYAAGNVNGLSLVPGTVAAASGNNISVDLTSGKWSASSGQSGTLSGAALTTLLTTLKNFRNSAETFAVNSGVVTGTQVAW